MTLEEFEAKAIEIGIVRFKVQRVGGKWHGHAECEDGWHLTAFFSPSLVECLVDMLARVKERQGQLDSSVKSTR